MHENASITCAIAETEMSFSMMLSMQPRTGGGHGASREDLISGIAKDMEDRYMFRKCTIERCELGKRSCLESISSGVDKKTLNISLVAVLSTTVSLWQ